MRQLALILFLFSTAVPAVSQSPYKTSDGIIRFNASTPLEDIEAINNKVNAILKEDTGDFAVVLLVKDFQFRRKLMQEHFNENYMESDTYPKAYFKGTIKNLSSVGISASSRQMEIEGELTIHGVTHKVVSTAELKRDKGCIYLGMVFDVRPESYNVKVTKILFKKIAENVAVTLDLILSASTSASE